MGQSLIASIPDIPGLLDKGKLPNGEVAIVEDVPSAWCHIVYSILLRHSQDNNPRKKPFTLTLSGGPTAQRCYEALAASASLPDSPPASSLSLSSPSSASSSSHSPSASPLSLPSSSSTPPSISPPAPPSISPPIQNISWKNINILVGDERCVPINHPDSNSGMIKTVLVDRLNDLGAFYPMDCQRGPSEYSSIISRYMPLDLVHLGMGADGHSASLFPGSAVLDEESLLVDYSRDPQQLNAHDRMTLLLPAINSSKQVIFTVSGREKLEAMTKAMQGSDIPALRVRAANVLWIVDEEANPR